MNRHIEFPTPTSPPAQAEFFLDFQHSTIAGVTGMGGGKTYSGAAKTVALAYMNPGLTGLACEPTHGMTRDILLPTYEKFLEENGIPYRMNRSQGQAEVLLTEPRFRIMLRSAENPDRLKGPNVVFFWMDEAGQAEEAAWQNGCSRVRDKSGKVLQKIATGTPEGLNWFYHTFGDKKRPGVAVYQWSTIDNAANLAAGYADGMRDTYDDTLYKSYVMGQFVPFVSGVVFDNFSGANVGPAKPVVGLPIYWGMDFNVDPFCAIGFQEGGGKVFAVAEVVIRNTHTTEAAEEMKRQFPLDRYPGQTIYCDPTGGNRHTAGGGHTDVDLLQRAGYKVDYNRFRTERDPINAGRALICNAAGQRKLVVGDHLERVITALKTWAYKPGSLQTQEKEYATDKNLYFVPHLADAFKYYAHSRHPIIKSEWRIG